MKDGEYLRTVCKIGQGPSTCKYIMGSPEGLCCGKLQAGWRDIIDSRSDMVAKGDNCDGVEGRVDLTAVGTAAPRIVGVAEVQ